MSNLSNIQKQQYLFAALMLFLLIGPLTDPVERPGVHLIMQCTLVLVFITGPFALKQTGVWLYTTMALAAGAAIVSISSLMLATLQPVAVVLGLLFFAYLMGLLLRRLLFETTAVDVQTLWLAVNVYVLAGLVFAFLYAVVALAAPDAFVGKFMDQPLRDQLYGFVYFSFVTLTTLGYGDLTPNNTFVGAVAFLQALFGQLYLAVMLARLVALYISRPASD